MPFGADQAGASEDTQVRGHGVLRHVELAGYLSGGKAVRFLAHQQPEYFEARSLRQRAQGGDSRVVFHISSIADMTSSASLLHTSRNAGLLAVETDRLRRGWTTTFLRGLAGRRTLDQNDEVGPIGPTAL